jgi:hypothetical protein
LCGEPIEESDRGSQVLSDEDVLVVGGVGASGPLSQAPQHVPQGVPSQQVLFLGVCSLGDGGIDPVFESHHLFVAGGQDSRGDEDAAQMLDGLPVGSSSSVWWVMARPASSRSIWGAALLSSHALSVAGRWVAASAR